MQNNTEQNETQEISVSIGIPVCECNCCKFELCDEYGNMAFSMEMLKCWLQKECPKVA